MESKYLGKVFEGRWKVVESRRYNYILENTYNGKQIEIAHSVFYRLLEGKTTVSKVINQRLIRTKQGRVILPRVNYKIEDLE